jgi:ATP-dependent helicase/DNAse subunit B
MPELGRVALRGRMDRIDRRGEKTVILDYKTGSLSRPKTDFSLETRAEWHKTLGSVQLPFYMMLYRAEHPEMDASTLDSCFMSLGSKKIEEVFLLEEAEERRLLYDRYEKAVLGLIEEILDPEADFTDSPTPQESCPSCRYKVICGRQWVVKNW